MRVKIHIKIILSMLLLLSGLVTAKIAMKTSEIRLAGKNQENIYTDSFTLPADFAQYKVQILLWDKVDEAVPLAEKKTY